MKRAVLAYSFSDKNAGDFSLTIATMSILTENGYFVDVISRFGKDSEEFKSTKNFLNKKFEGKFNMIESPFHLDRDASFFKRQKNNFTSFLTARNVIKDQEMIEVVKKSDIVVLCPGNLLRCGSWEDYMRLEALDYPLGLARKYNKRYIIFPQSSSDIKDYGKKILGRMINGSHTTFTREELSYSKLKTLYPDANLVSSIDVAFFLAETHRFKENNEKVSIGFTIRGDGIGGLQGLGTQDKKLLKDRLNYIIKKLKSKDVKLTFVVQGTKADADFTGECADFFFEKYGLDIPVIEEHDTDKLLDLYSTYDCLIGMRLHSIILAAAAGTPSYGLFLNEWGLKNPGIMNQINLPFAIADSQTDSQINFQEIEQLLDTKRSFQERYVKFLKAEEEKFYQSLSPDLN